MTSPCEIIHQSIALLYECKEVNGFTRIRTPYLYPDGDLVDVYVKLDSTDGLTITDLGETLRWLRMQTTSPKRSLRMNQLIADVRVTHGVELYRGALSLRSEEKNLASDVIRVAQAAVRVADLWFTMRSRAGEVVTDEVAEFLSENSVQFVRNEKTVGRSGRERQIDFHTYMPQKSTLVYVLTTSSRAAARGLVEHVFAGWFDLSHLRYSPQPTELISLFDDTIDVWAPEDIKLVEEVSEVSYWSRPDDFLQRVAA